MLNVQRKANILALVPQRNVFYMLTRVNDSLLDYLLTSNSDDYFLIHQSKYLYKPYDFQDQITSDNEKCVSYSKSAHFTFILLSQLSKNVYNACL